jgi:regulator of replication initiation timing
MATTELVLGGTTFSVSRAALTKTCEIFQANPGLLTVPYLVRSTVSEDVLIHFVGFINGEPPVITLSNISGLFVLSQEFGFRFLRDCLSDCTTAKTCVWELSSLRNRVRHGERTMCELEDVIADLRSSLSNIGSTLKTEIVRLRDNISTLLRQESIASENTGLECEISRVPGELGHLCSEISTLSRKESIASENTCLRSELSQMRERFDQEVAQLKADISLLQAQLRPQDTTVQPLRD